MKKAPAGQGPLDRYAIPCLPSRVVPSDGTTRPQPHSRTPSMSNTPLQTSDRATLDELFACLSHPTRRRIVTTLAADNPRDESEFECAAFRPDDEPPERFRIHLYHEHLPKLAENGYIEWDRESDTVTRGPAFEEVRPVITLMDEHQDELPAAWP